MSREICDHKCGVLNEALRVTASDDVGPGGANHMYAIGIPAKEGPEGYKSLAIRFQKGGCHEAGINGVSDEVLMVIVMDRLRGFQRGPAGPRHDDDVRVFRLKDVAERQGRWLEDVLVEVLVVMTDGGLVHGLDDRPRQLGRPRDHENGAIARSAPANGRFHNAPPLV